MFVANSTQDIDLLSIQDSIIDESLIESLEDSLSYLDMIEFWESH